MSSRIRYLVAHLLLPFHEFWTRWGSKPGNEAFRILVLHDVPESHTPHFKRLLDYLLEEHGIITPQEAASRLLKKVFSKSIRQIPYLLTFDDGFKSNALVVQKILGEYGLKAIFFICPGLVDLPPEKQLQTAPPNIFRKNLPSPEVSSNFSLMNWEDLKSLVKDGHTIGSHTWSHRKLSSLSQPEDLAQEIIKPVAKIKNKLGIGIEWFAYPFGDLESIDALSLQLIEKKYKFFCTGLRGINSLKTPLMGLCRESINFNMDFDYQKIILKGGLDLCYHIKLMRYNKLVT